MAQSILAWKGFKFVQMKGQTLFKGEIISKIFKIYQNLKNLLQNHWVNLNQSIRYVWVAVYYYSNEGPHSSTSGYNIEIVKRNLIYLHVCLTLSKEDNSI